ncbi:hypothetical protein P9E76_04510 [Schinkia azotoformans]|uniref:YpoC-like domain-containing protein n=1 Tax=Schinkia azotoformans LMG 9581 TaxID=1131731 RepID=K6DG56_SCHAZ|nr:hypothetical protein [Schinkia azotoformans]EKN67314.1 hypothetical protein BAZO_09136 [Schinkia azotoformans LMG 9581]MEC1639433.1 hypothetical protein [Schinkia azotoformans]MEC1719616.1 hypothetical protein [Schinkia azotoformans]MEC1944313.1 hypothetical protein [Schinkia azotoformans]MED4352622.1 hypothetical protein [Schinkia azotoformans]
MSERHFPLDTVFNQWYSEKDGIAKFFRDRNTQAARAPMKKHIANFFAVLFEINNLQLNNSDEVIEQVDKLKIKPINSKERLSFLIESPTHYHSFIQLSEMFEELEKQYRKLLAIEQNKTRITDQ